MYKGAKADFLKLREYARELGISVRLIEAPASLGLFNYEDEIIEINSSMTYEDKVLTLLHEVGHAKDWITSGKKPRPKADRARIKADSEKTFDDRWAIYMDECAGISWMRSLAYALSLDIPYQLVCVQEEADRWMYRAFAERGVFPSKKEKANNLKFLKTIWGIK